MRRGLAAALAASLIIVLAGCGDDEEGGQETATGEATSTAASGGDGVGLEKVGDFDTPVYVAQPPGGEDLYVVERDGRVKIVRDGETLSKPFLDISDQTATDVEQGLLSIAFAPDYEQTGLLYAYVTGTDGKQRVVEFKRSADDPDSVESGEPRTVLEMDDFAPNHNGGLIVFGEDGQLYVGTGDGGGAGDPRRNAQNRNSLLGKLLRLDPRARGQEPEIYAYGLRNPWRFDFDEQGGNLVIADVGQDSQEEVDIVRTADAQGANFGWSAFEGTEPFNEDQSAPGAIEPAHTYGRDQGCSITGGYVVRDPALPALAGRYVYSDFCSGKLRSFKIEGTSAADDKPLGLDVPATSSFGIDNAGQIYATSFEGPVYRLVPK